MCERNFWMVYKPEKQLSMDVGCCQFKVQLSFNVYNPEKPNSLNVKIYQVCEAKGGLCN